jgi:hypothetical protein
LKTVMTVADLAERWGCSDETVIRRANEGEPTLPSFHIGKAHTVGTRARLWLRFRLADVERWEDDRATIPPADAAEAKDLRATAPRPTWSTGKIYTRTGKPR